MSIQFVKRGRNQSWFAPIVPALVAAWGMLAWHFYANSPIVQEESAQWAKADAQASEPTAIEAEETTPAEPPPSPAYSPVTAESVYLAINSCTSYGWDLNDVTKVLFYECEEGGFTAADIVTLRAARIYATVAQELRDLSCFVRPENAAIGFMDRIGCPDGVKPQPLSKVGPYTTEIGVSGRLEDCRPVAWPRYSASTIQDFEASVEGAESGIPEPVLLACGSGLLNQTYMTPLQRDNELSAKKKVSKKKSARHQQKTVRLPVLRPNSNIKLPRPPKLTEEDKAAVAETLAH